MSTRRRTSILACAAGLLVSAGCTDSSDRNSSPSAEPAPSPAGSTAGLDASAGPTAAGYVARVNDLCAQLLSQVLAFDIGNDVSIEAFQAKRAKLLPLISAFDQEVATIPVPAEDRAAAETFDAYREFSDSTDARLAAAAATGDQAKFDTENQAVLDEVHSSSKVDDLRATGIVCNAR